MLRTAARSFVLMMLVAFTRPALGGDLNPPVGPIAPTMKALDVVEPRTPLNQETAPGDAGAFFRITQPGSYYLTSPIELAAGQAGIVIAASQVSIDLNGFTISGPEGGTSGDGISVEASPTQIRVKNGGVRRVTQGINCSNCADGRFEDLSVSECSANGMLLGSFAVVERCTARVCAFTGFSAGRGSVISGCAATSCGTVGIYSPDPGCMIRSCTASLNNSSGIRLDFGGSIIDCVATSNRENGIVVFRSCIVRGCASSDNGFGGSGAGIRAISFDNRLEGNLCTSNTRGIDVDQAGNFITRNTCSGNTTNWDVVTGNIILVVNGAPAGAVVGNSGGVAPGSADPNANFTF
jgi:parallel beta-helix repeat protein